VRQIQFLQVPTLVFFLAHLIDSPAGMGSGEGTASEALLTAAPWSFFPLLARKILLQHLLLSTNFLAQLILQILRCSAADRDIGTRSRKSLRASAF
jgi:hypothetical protein